MTNHQTNHKIQYFKNIFHYFEALYWAWKCGWPGKKMYLIGVTGTDGKTTTATIIYEILKKAGYKAGLFSTVEVKYVTELPITNYQLPNKFQISNFKFQIKEHILGKGLHTTNPGPELLQPILKQMYEAGVTHVVMEVTSHGLDQNRVVGCDFQIGVWTNLSHEHLDYHKNMQNYANAKIKLFENTRYAVLNEDDKYYAYFKSQITNLPAGRAGHKSQTIIQYTKSKVQRVSSALAGEYNKYNIAAAAAVAAILKIQETITKQVVKNFEGVAGRRQEVKNTRGFKVYVDFAHTPNGLEQVLRALRKELVLRRATLAQDENRLILIFGCTGERDKEKRPMMGEIAARLADIVIITSDDTREESQDEIAAQIKSGITSDQLSVTSVYTINDRREAIKKAFSLAKKGDIVLLAGKGHEKSILLGKTEYPWNDVDEASKMLVP